MKMLSMRERMTAVLKGQECDRAPFVVYDHPDIGFPAKEELWPAVGRENIGLLRWAFLHRAETPNCRVDQEDIVRDGTPGIHRTLHTPEGQLSEERLTEPTYGTTSAASHFVKTPEDYRVLLAYFRDMTIHKDLSLFSGALDQIGGDGLPNPGVLRTPYQQLWIEWTDIRDLVEHMAMYPDVMEEVLAEMNRIQHRVFEVVCEAVGEAPITHVDFPDNITAPMIGESLFRAHCMPGYKEFSDMLRETGKDIPIFVHMDGDLGPLWDAIGESSVCGIESMSPAPDNDTSVADAVAQWPEMYLWINFPSSVHLRPPEEIYQVALEILETCRRRGRLQFQISENVPPGAWRKSLPHIIKAINDAGPLGSS